MSQLQLFAPADPPLSQRTRGELIDHLLLRAGRQAWGGVPREQRCERLLRVVDELDELGRATAKVLAERLGSPYEEVRHELRMLKRAGLVVSRTGHPPAGGWLLTFQLRATPPSA